MRISLISGGLFLSLTLPGCEHYKPMGFPDQNNQKEKPGLFSGKKGQFEIGMRVPWSAHDKANGVNLEETGEGDD